MREYLVYKDDKSNKFWQIETTGNSFTVTYGRTGATGQTSSKSFDSEQQCLAEAKKLLNEKLKKGYAAGASTPAPVVANKNAPSSPDALLKKLYNRPCTMQLDNERQTLYVFRWKDKEDRLFYLFEDNVITGFSDNLIPFAIIYDVDSAADISEHDQKDDYHYFGSIMDNYSVRENALLLIQKETGKIFKSNADGLIEEYTQDLQALDVAIYKTNSRLSNYDEFKYELDESTSLYNENNYDQTLAKLNRLLQPYENKPGKSAQVSNELPDLIGNAFNLRGAVKDELKQDSHLDYVKALEYHNKSAALNLAEYYCFQTKEYEKVLEIIKDNNHYYDNDKENSAKVAVTGISYLLTGQTEKANKTYQDHGERLFKRHGSPLALVQEQLDKINEIIISPQLPQAKAAQQIIDSLNQLCKEKTETLEREKKLALTYEKLTPRQWWNSLDEIWKKVLLQDLKGSYNIKSTNAADHELNQLMGKTKIVIEGVDLSGDKFGLICQLGPLSRMKALEIIEADNCSPIRGGVTALASLPALRELKSSELLDLEGLDQLKNLTILNLQGSKKINDYSILARLKQLENLRLYNTNIASLDTLAELTSLKVLNIGRTSCPDLTPLAGLVQLKSLTMNSSAVKDLTPLANLINLQDLDISETPVSNLKPLENLKNLKEINFSRSQVSNEEKARFKKKHPKCKIGR